MSLPWPPEYQQELKVAEPRDETTRKSHTGGKIGETSAPTVPIILAAGNEPVPGYVLDRRLGRGAYGEVWRATAPGGVTVAVKFVPISEGIGDAEIRALELMKNIHHPHLTGVSGIWHHEDVLIIAMELGDRTLADCLAEAQNEGRTGIPPELLHEYMREAAKGIDFLNTHQIVHRDIKPKNLLLMSGGVKVADFGLAKVLERTLSTSSNTMTPAYAPPELFEGQPSSQSDQYSLAVSYCQLRGGRLPFNGPAIQLMASHISGTPDLSMLPAEEQPAVRRAMAKNPKDRWPDCRTFVATLAGSDIGRRVTLPATSTPNRRGFIVGGLAIIALGVAELTRQYATVRDPLGQLRETEIEREVSLLKATTPTALREHAPNYTEVDQLVPIDNSAFETLSDDRVVDLRLWKEVPSGRMNELYTPVSMTRRLRLKKTKSAEIFQSESKTAGLDVLQKCLSLFPYRGIGQRGEVYIGTDRMKVRRLVIDVSSVPEDVEFDLRTIATYWNTFQTEQELWFGVVGYEKSFKVSQLLLFPADKPFKEYSLMVARTVKDTPTIYTGPKLLLNGSARDWIYWEVPNPKEGFVYRLHWKW
jgi:hypothetical protein